MSLVDDEDEEEDCIGFFFNMNRLALCVDHDFEHDILFKSRIFIVLSCILTEYRKRNLSIRRYKRDLVSTANTSIDCLRLLIRYESTV